MSTALQSKNYLAAKELLSDQVAQRTALVIRQRHYRDNPLDWIVDRLGVRRETIDWTLNKAYKKHVWRGTPNPLMRILSNMARSRWTAVEAAVGVSKTYLCACILLWFLECWPKSRIVTGAPKADQLKLHLWSELSNLWPRFGRGELQSLELKMEPPSDYWSAVGFVAGVKREELGMAAIKAQGFHRPDQLIILEETAGIANEVMAPLINTSTAPHNIVLAVGNPNNQNDTLHRFSRLSRVNTVRIDARDYPNVVMRDPGFIPGAQTILGLDTLLDEYKSETNPMFLSRAYGISPAQAVDSLIKYEWCVAAARRSLLQSKPGPRALGVDVARSEAGDPAVIARGDGSALLDLESMQCPNVVAFAGKVHGIMVQHEIDAWHVGIDAVGVGGGTCDELRRLETPVVELQSGGTAMETSATAERFDNLRSQMWWQMMKDLRDGEQSGIVLPWDEELFSDLCSVRFGEDKKVIKIDPKTKVKKLLGRSTNKGDAAVYWNWVRAPRYTVAGAVGLDDAPVEAGIDDERYEKDAYKSERRRLW